MAFWSTGISRYADIMDGALNSVNKKKTYVKNMVIKVKNMTLTTVAMANLYSKSMATAGSPQQIQPTFRAWKEADTALFDGDGSIDGSWSAEDVRGAGAPAPAGAIRPSSQTEVG